MSVPPLTAVLVHDAWHDGRCWNSVANQLQRWGMAVVAPTLPSTDPGPDLPGFAADVGAVVDALDALRGPVVLCGHGYGGMVISEAGHHPRVTRLVYLAAACPRPGEAALDHCPRLRTVIRPTGDGRTTLAPRPALKRFYGDLNPRWAQTWAARLRPSTARILEARVAEPAWLTTPTTYVRCEGDRILTSRRSRAVAAQVMIHQLGRGSADGYNVRLQCGHSPFYADPAAVAEIVAHARVVNGYPKR